MAGQVAVFHGNGYLKKVISEISRFINVSVWNVDSVYPIVCGSHASIFFCQATFVECEHALFKCRPPFFQFTLFTDRTCSCLFPINVSVLIELQLLDLLPGGIGSLIDKLSPCPHFLMKTFYFHPQFCHSASNLKVIPR